MALRGQRINDFIELHMMPSGLKRFGNLCFINQFWKKNISTGLNSLRQKEYQRSVKNWIFDDPFHKKGLLLVICTANILRVKNTTFRYVFPMHFQCLFCIYLLSQVQWIYMVFPVVFLEKKIISWRL